MHLQGLKELVELRGGYSSRNIRCGAMLAAIFTYVQHSLRPPPPPAASGAILANQPTTQQGGCESSIGPHDQAGVSSDLGVEPDAKSRS